MPIQRNSAYRAAGHGFLQRCLGFALVVVVLTAANAAHAEDDFMTWIFKSVSPDEDGDTLQAPSPQEPQVGGVSGGANSDFGGAVSGALGGVGGALRGAPRGTDRKR